MVVYDPQTRSELQTGQPFPSKDNQRDRLIANATARWIVTSVPMSLPAREANRIQTVLTKGWFAFIEAQAFREIMVKYLAPTAVFMLMMSIGMSLSVPLLVQNWRRLNATLWLKLVVATFLIPPALVIILAELLPLTPASVAGLFLVAVAPGAPLLTRGLAKKRGW